MKQKSKDRLERVYVEEHIIIIQTTFSPFPCLARAHMADTHYIRYQCWHLKIKPTKLLLVAAFSVEVTSLLNYTDTEFSLDLQMEPVDFAKKMRNWSRKGFEELGDMGGMGIGRTTYSVLHHPNFLTNPHQV